MNQSGLSEDLADSGGEVAVGRTSPLPFLWNITFKLSVLPLSLHPWRRSK
jgi:hypothetical protein